MQQETAYKKLVEGIKNAQSAYQDVEDTEKKLDETEQDIADHQKERYEKRIEQIEAENLQVFADTITNQNLEMIPLSEFPNQWDQTEIFNTPPQNL